MSLAPFHWVDRPVYITIARPVPFVHRTTLAQMIRQMIIVQFLNHTFGTEVIRMVKSCGFNVPKKRIWSSLLDSKVLFLLNMSGYKRDSQRIVNLKERNAIQKLAVFAPYSISLFFFPISSRLRKRAKNFQYSSRKCEEKSWKFQKFFISQINKGNKTIR